MPSLICSIRDRLHATPIVMQLPIGAENDFEGRADREVEVRAHLVHRVDEADAGDLVRVSLTPHGLGLGLNEGAYLAEIMRAGLLSVPKGLRKDDATKNRRTRHSQGGGRLPLAIFK